MDYSTLSKKIISHVERTGDWKMARRFITKTSDDHIHSMKEVLFSAAFDLAEKSYKNNGSWKRAFDAWSEG